jgi:hypothetical protein
MSCSMTNLTLPIEILRVRLKTKLKQKGKYCYLKVPAFICTFYVMWLYFEKRTNTETLKKNEHEKYAQYRADTNGSYTHQTASDALY